MTRRQHLAATIILVVVVFLSFSYLMSRPSDADVPAKTSRGKSLMKDAISSDLGGLSQDILIGGAIAPKLENATAK